ncbi:hypothetical protein MASR2M117_04530 [Paludibacter sp.]
MDFLQKIYISTKKLSVLLILSLVFYSCTDDVSLLSDVYWEESSTINSNISSTNLIIAGKSNQKWSAEIIEGAGWCSFSNTDSALTVTNGVLDKIENKITLFFKNNNTKQPRIAKISLTLQGNNKEIFTITQTPGFSIFTETPSVVVSDNFQYITHYTKLRDKTVRNYSMCFDNTKKASLWVAYPIHSSYFGSVGRTDAWAFDPNISTNFQAFCVTGYYGGIYDRGHQIASADRQANKEMNEQTFYMTNMTPQLNRLNQDMWAKLEMKVRSNNCSDTLFVVTGAYFDPSSSKTTTDGSYNRVPVPTHYYKILLRTKSGNTGKTISQCADNELMSIGFWVEHKSYGNIEPPKSICTTVSDIESKTGFTFFPSVSGNVKNQNDPGKWGVY